MCIYIYIYISLVCFLLLLKREIKKCLTLAAYFLRLETTGLPACFPLISLLFFGTLHSNGYLSISPLPLPSLLFTAICKAFSDNHFAFLHFFFLGMFLITAFCTMSWISVRSSSGTLSDLIPWICLSLPLNNCKGFDLDHSYLNVPVVFPTFFSLRLNFALRSSWSEPQSALGLAFAACIELLHLWL